MAGGGHLWAVVRIAVVGSHGVLVGGESRCLSWLWVVIGIHCCSHLQAVLGHHCKQLLWVIFTVCEYWSWVMVVICCAVIDLWSLWLFVVVCIHGQSFCHCKWLLWAVFAVCCGGSHCQSLCVLLVAVKRGEATSCCQTNVACYPLQINNKQINNSSKIPFLPILGNILV